MPLLHGWDVRGILEHVVDGDEAGGWGSAAPGGCCGLLVAGIGDLGKGVAARAVVSVICCIGWGILLVLVLHAMQQTAAVAFSFFFISWGGESGRE